MGLHELTDDVLRARARERAEWEKNHDTYILNIQDENGNMCPCHVNQETYMRLYVGQRIEWNNP